jgi:hypothetical protein
MQLILSVFINIIFWTSYVIQKYLKKKYKTFDFASLPSIKKFMVLLSTKIILDIVLILGLSYKAVIGFSINKFICIGLALLAMVITLSLIEWIKFLSRLLALIKIRKSYEHNPNQN